MLPIMQRLIMPRLAALKEKRITAALLGEWIETHHQTCADLRAVAEWMRIHPHDPVWRIDAVIAASRAHVGVTRENCAMQHEHVITEYEHSSVHCRRIRQPACA